MRLKAVIVMFLTVCVILCNACDRKPCKESLTAQEFPPLSSYNEHVAEVPPTAEGILNYRIEFEEYPCFFGQLPVAEQVLPTVSIEKSPSGIRYKGTDYVLYCENMIGWDTPFLYHWIVNLAQFVPVAYDAEESLVCVPKWEEEPTIVLLCDAPVAQQVACYVRCDSTVLDITSYTVDDFIIRIDGRSAAQEYSEMFARVWNMHTSTEESSRFVADGDHREYHTIQMLCKEHPGLVYKFGYTVVDGMADYVEIYNIFDSEANSMGIHPLERPES